MVLSPREDGEAKSPMSAQRALTNFSKGIGTSLRSGFRTHVAPSTSSSTASVEIPGQPLTPLQHQQQQHLAHQQKIQQQQMQQEQMLQHQLMLEEAENEVDLDAQARQEAARQAVLEGGFARLLDGENYYPLISGVLAVKVVHGELVHGVYEESNLIFVRLRVRNVIKYTDRARHWGSKFTWGSIKYFPVRVLHNPRHPFNLFHFDVIQVPPHQSFVTAAKDPANTIGSIPFHVHDLVRGSPCTGSYSILHNHRNVGSLTLEFYFSYGSLGFGYSYQLKSDESPETLLEYSMLPRCIPDAHCDEWSRTISVPSRQAYHEILDENEHEKRFPLVHARMKRLGDLREQYASIGEHSRIDRLAFLHKQINDTALTDSKVTPPVFGHTAEAGSTKNPSFFHRFMRPTIPVQHHEEDPDEIIIDDGDGSSDRNSDQF